ncbi:hypothetical protein [Litorisediminicola beolgyonensis]|uniref:Antibiotic biosynthesis monooxygenase n=1 Tax=Litorisediminicola beolgyonensis TaxID=1173614 RepID=A0ABW3ZD20_9RHOB
MPFIVLSHWKTTDWTDELEALAQDTFVPMILAAGAVRVRMVRTGDRSFTVVTEYADAAAAEAAQEKIQAIRSKAATELPMSLDGTEGAMAFAAS